MHPWGYARRRPAGADGVRHIDRSTAADGWRTLSIGNEPLPIRGLRTTTKTVDGHVAFEFAVSVVDDKGDLLGSLRYGLSDQPLQEALAEARAASREALLTAVALLILVGLAANVLGVLLSRGAAARITQPLAELTGAVNAFARGERATRVEIDSGDEIELLGTAFNKMATDLADYYARLEQMNRTLEAKVDERTRALALRNGDMRLVLDNVDQGLLTLSASGVLGEERSSIVDRWFGAPAAGTLFAEYIRTVDPAFAQAFELGHEALLEGFLPTDLCLSQLPQRLLHQGRNYHCHYTAIMAGERLDGLLIVIKDVTAELQQAKQEAEGKEVLALFNALASDRARFLSFVDEVNELLARLPGADVVVQRRVLHTIKGNAGLVGLSVVAGICHQLEDQIDDLCAPLSRRAFAPLEGRWGELTQQLRVLLGDKGRDLVEVSQRDLLRLDQEIQEGALPSHIRDRLAALTLEPAERPLEHLARYAQALALRCEKGEVDVRVDAGGVRLAARQWESVWAEMVHVVRNAIDHGLEPEAERRRTAKPIPAVVHLRTAVVDGALTIEVEDDGAGIDWGAVRAAAAVRGLPHDSEEDLRRALFSDGLTTRRAVTDLSGRGVGLAALLRVIEARGGRAIVRSEAGVGSSFKLVFPVASIGPRTGVDVIGPMMAVEDVERRSYAALTPVQGVG
jgi:two-component system chemotaxis sensor kinase CheA